MTVFKIDLRNQVRQTVLPKWKPLIPLFEAVMNSIQSIHERKPKIAGKITITISRDVNLLPNEDSPIGAFTIADNGVGLTDENFDSFNTAFSGRKEREGGKGLGRLTWLKAFEVVEIESGFKPEGEDHLARVFHFNEKYTPDAGMPKAATVRSIGMEVRLKGFKEPYKSQCPKTADQIVQRLVEHFLLIFLEPNCPIIEVIDGGLRHVANDVFEKDFKANATVHDFSVKDVPFKLHGFSLTTPRVSNHRLVYAANRRGVLTENLKDFIPNLSTRLETKDGKSFVYLGILQSAYLTQRVNPVRTDFDIATGEDAESDQPELFEQEIRKTEIRSQALDLIQKDLADAITSINEVKEEKIRTYVHDDAPQYKVLMKYSDQFINKIPPTASKAEIDVALHRELYEREVDMKREGARIIREAAKVEDYEAYHVKFQQFMDSYNELGTAALAQYVMHRKILLEFLRQAVSRDAATGKYPLEEVVHNLVFPMRSTSDDIPTHEQNLWMLDERLTFHSFVASDKRLDSNVGRLESTSAKRPDMLIFDEKIVFSDVKPDEHPISSITIVEFKKPNRNDYTLSDNPISQCFDLVEVIRSGKFVVKGRAVSVSNRHIPATVYAVCDLTDSLRASLKGLDAFETPDEQGYYGFQRNFGIYYEVIDYNKLLRDAERRNRIFFDKLNILGGFGGR